MYILLSHILNENVPTYMKTGFLKIETVKQIKKGDSSNTFVLSF